MTKRSGPRWIVAAACVLALAPRSAGAAVEIKSFAGHVAFGYAKLFNTDAPGGSLSMSGGLDYPIVTNLRAGIDVGYHLLGTRTVPRGSLVANVDYRVFEAILYAHWSPPGLGPIGRISVGPELFSARADLSTSGGGIGFGDLAVEQNGAGVALDVTLIKRSPAPVRVGFDLGGRVGFIAPESWKMAMARVSIHY